MLTITVGPELEEEIRAIARRSGVEAEDAGRVLLAAEVRRQAMPEPVRLSPEELASRLAELGKNTPPGVYIHDETAIRDLAYEGVAR